MFTLLLKYFHGQNIYIKIYYIDQCLKAAAKFLEDNGGLTDQVVGVGITNQRETTVAWDKNTGKPLYNAIVWHDSRTKELVHDLKKKELLLKDKDDLKKRSGLPISTYFSASKVTSMCNCITIFRIIPK